ncbi:MAG: ECF transporter S component [Hungatella sp.]|jgi:energy-coupling factor transport system substrate-specific component|nr:ECF transporter S component [Hungatella sp.]
MNRKKITVFQLCVVAMAVGINMVGGQLALLLRLPIYLDSIGTILTGALLGPWFGMLPNLLSGVLMGMTTDIYSLYFAPVGMVIGFMNGLVWQRWIWKRPGIAGKGRLWLWALAVAIPGTIVSSVICAAVFGGVTSSGSMVLVQLLAKTPIGMTASIFLVQIVTDYLDRALSMMLVSAFLQVLPVEMRDSLKCRTKVAGRR